MPWVSPDELTIYFTSARTGGSGGYDLWTATRATRDGSFGNLQRLTALNTASNDEGASLMADELTIFFTSDRANGAGQLDIWMSTRATKTSPLSPAVNVAVVNSAADEMNVAVSADGRELFFSSDRGAGATPPHVLWPPIGRNDQDWLSWSARAGLTRTAARTWVRPRTARLGGEPCIAIGAIGQYNATLYYDDSRFSARASLAYRSDFLTEGPNSAE